jgi:ssDNA-binding Zn-finger/Zn-ribbon topoisomerase 1
MSYSVPLHEGTVTCPYCNVEADYVDSEIVYGGNSFGMIYLCSNYPKCDARSGTRGEGRPIGTLARKELRDLRKECHAKLDPLWKEGKMTRSEAYTFLRKLMRLLDPKAAHIGRFDEARCRDFLVRIDCPTCSAILDGFGPSHNGSTCCRNVRAGGNGAIAAGGTVPHCTCDGCF